jgi:hypothetical protein
MSLLILPTYSFADVYGLLSGPGGSVPFGNGTGQAEEGISFEQSEDKNRKTAGASGDVMNALILDDSGKAHIHTLKTSPINAALNQMFNFQKLSSLSWGLNLLNMTNPVSGDQYSCVQVAFTRRPSNTFGKDPNALVWEFDCGHIFVTLGA